MLEHESLLSQQKSAKNGQNLLGESLMGNKLSNLGHYRTAKTLSPSLGLEEPITAEFWMRRTVDGLLVTSQIITQCPAWLLPGSNNPNMASHHIAAGVQTVSEIM